MELGTLINTRPSAPVQRQHPYNPCVPPHPRSHQRRGSDGLKMIDISRFIARLAVLLAVCVMGTCGWVLHKTIQDWGNPTLKTASTLLSQVNTFFGGTTGLYDLDLIYRILTSCSATSFVGGILQFFLSVWLFSALEKDDRSVSRVWAICHLFIMPAVGGAFLCIVTNELKINDAVTALLIVSGVDFVLVIPFSLFIFMYSAQDRAGTRV